MNDEELLALYEWAPGKCFRHPAAGTVGTALVKTIRPRLDGEKEVRACRRCVLAMEGIRREAAERAGLDYEPGHAGEALG
ncbi:hypothetical protein [Streptomyces luteocolor]|uniref:hypothetical protein n=1 Tax=Streptomyces luteocolor TaxID=285500 RepID=UPI000853EBFA|nr:hypothetical protein [Streptomyces luteocolor]